MVYGQILVVINLNKIIVTLRNKYIWHFYVIVSQKIFIIVCKIDNL